MDPKGSGKLRRAVRDGCKPAARILRDVVLAFRVAGFLADDRIDVLYAHQTSMALLATLAVLRGHTPVVLAIHSADGGDAGWVRRRLLSWSLSRAAAVVAVASASLDVLPFAGQSARSRASVIPNGVRAPLQVPKDPGALIGQVGCAGNLTQIKRQDLAIMSLARIRRRIPECRLLLAGDGPLRESLRALTAESGLDGAVEFLGGYEGSEDARYREFLGSIDVLLVTSRTEACPLVVLEAMGSGVPVVSFDNGGMRDLIEDGSTGHLVTDGDIDGLAGAVVSLLEDADLRRRTADAARESYLTRFTPDAMSARVAFVLHTATGRGR